jgi:hypothetical protein
MSSSCGTLIREARRAVETVIDYIDTRHDPSERQSWQRLAALVAEAQQTCHQAGLRYHKLLQQRLQERPVVPAQ